MDKSSLNPGSSIIWGTVFHSRMSPRKHEFSYPMVTLQLDLDRLESNLDDSIIFGYEKRRFLSIWEGDYLRGLTDYGDYTQSSGAQVSGAMRRKVQGELIKRGVSEVPARITLVTMPRILGYVFNPVSFFLCFDCDERLIACITQVHNTFGEAHIYPLVCEARPLPVEWRFPKEFFVSPFFDSAGEYLVRVDREGQRLALSVDLFKSGSQVFASSLVGEAQSLSRASLLSTLLRYPLALFLTMPRIHLQALNIFFKGKITPFVKPVPQSTYTIRSRQNMIHRARLWLLDKMRFMRMRGG